MNPLISSMVLILVMVIAIGIVINIGMPAVNTAKETAGMKEAESAIKTLDNYIKEVRSEGSGSERRIKFTSPGEFIASPDEDSIQFKSVSDVELFEYFTRRMAGSLMYISGSDVSCSSGSNLTMENSFLKAVFQLTPKATPLAAIDTKSNILTIQEKSSSSIASFSNTTVFVDGVSGNGTGYSELLASGTTLPSCTVHFFIDSTSDYDIYYTLYAGADFLVAEIRNVS